MGKNIKLTPEMLREMVSETVKRVLSEGMDEISYQTISAAAEKADPSWYEDSEGNSSDHNRYDEFSYKDLRDTDDVLRCLATVKNFIYRFDGPQQDDFISMLYRIEEFVERKKRQSKVFASGAKNKQQEMDAEVLKWAKRYGYNGNDLNEFYKSLDYDGLENFVDSIEDPEVKTYVENS